MSSQQPTNPRPPPRQKEPSYLPRVQRAQPHLGESDRTAFSRWAILAGTLLVLVTSIALIVLWLRPLKDTLPVSEAPTAALPSAITTPTNAPPLAASTATSPAPIPTTAIVKYRVRSGDNLTTIAQRYRVSIRALMVANGLKDETIRIGDELIIPLTTPSP